MLLDYFKLNSENALARQYYYGEIPKHFTHKKQKNETVYLDKWNPRKKHFNVIRRMYSVSPTQLELFHLRLLLLHVKGAVSFESLRTVDNVIHPTFTAACLALGLIENDEEWKRAIEEGTKCMMPQKLRYLFVRILIHCQPLNPEELWDQFKNQLSEDFSRYHDESISNKMAYFHIDTLLNEEGRSLADFPTMNQFVETEFPCLHQLAFPRSLQPTAERGQDRYNNLNPQQKQIVDMVVEAVQNINYTGPKRIYMDGPGGSRKTYVYETIYCKLNSENIKICAMAFTGIAATLLPHGKTVHKTFGLPVPMFQDSSSNIKAQSKEAQLLRETKVFIWDEISMAPRYALEIVNKTLQNFMNYNLPFGGKVIIVGGDLRQFLPIKVHGTRSEILSLCVKYSPVWNYFTKFSLTTNMRVLPNEIEFSKFLFNLGNGTLNDLNDNVNLPEQCILPQNVNLIDSIFRKLFEEKKFQEMSKCAILSARNVDVDDINKQITNLLNIDSERIYTAIDVVINNNSEIDDVILPEHLHNLNPPSLTPHELRLRKNCIRRQFPIKLAFAMAINKAQGQTFTNTGIDLRRDVFNYGQLYVAMSRVKSWNSVKVYLENQVETRKVKNFVNKELYV
ncbi:ATP-dependent DNA helicase pif1-like [Phymastichus coffea]|uniref:ATP-dependent DNA helicase pif1-like n=1 Tax=Phymastichus coffea TaxID=108790 RepID=UPI00273C502C|nr:ATP-dependent DNA helicase pif1-like [Phymastichus coffea]